jgi:hypothetical protein
MRNVSDKSFRENQNKYFMFSDFFSENSAFCKIITKKDGRARLAADDNTIWRVRFAWCINEATKTPPAYVMLLAFHSNNG